MSKNPVVHFEMPYDDAARVRKFYETAFGWGTMQFGPEMGSYITCQTAETDDDMMVKTPGTINGGLSPRNEDYRETRVVISVDDITAAIGAVRAAGGTVNGDPYDIPGIGLYVAIHDTEGNKVSLLQPAMR